ncbi:FTR1 family protein [Leptotrichia sp. oral taxon 879]|uniref:FTR1 family iron permease n=1 Tax=Leptotrichia sp. oral taxon 879 TaxID=1227267 RepID=UPI00040D3D9F|nr:FTR1 family protein [Leptotrichia sp. oral taxon 879]
MGRNYLNKISIMLFLCFMLSFTNIIAKESYSNLYIKITDTTTAIKNSNQNEAKKLYSEIREEFKKVKNSDSTQGKKVQELLNKEKSALSENDLKEVTTALLAFEKEQNPVNDNEEKKKFQSRMYPALDILEKAIQSKNVELMKKEYLKFNGVWTRNESFIRSRSIPYYGKVETAMSFLRSSMEVEPFDYDSTMNSFNELKSAIKDYLDGKKIENNVSSTITLKEAVDMLKDALDAFKTGNKAKGQSKVKQFIQVWPTVEGDVSTRNSSLYTKVETQTPIIMVKGSEKEYQEQLQGLITELSQIDTKAQYTFVDAMFILLREGVEALLIVLALVSSLKAANQKKGLRWVYAGAAFGILASVIIAFMLQALFPAVSSGTNREILEGIVGIFAVIMMIGIGFWLHSKSSLKSWKDYIDRKMDVVLSTGSFISMFVLSFLAVFREGAETILFYVGILPLISLQSLIIGIVSAILILVVIAFVLIYASSKIKIHQIFLVLTWTIYFLAFKMLGTSIHMLQVVGILPLHVVNFIPTVEILGIYANMEVFICQLILITIIAFATFKRKDK